MAFPRPGDYRTYTGPRGSSDDWARKARRLAQLAVESDTVSENLRILGLTSTPDAASLKRAFKKAAFMTHPDQGGSNEEFIRVKKAYDELMLEL